MMKLLIALFAAGVPFAVVAQQPADSTRRDTLRGITITATRLPAKAQESALSVTVLDSAYLRGAQPQLTLQESLGAVPGVFVLNDANFAQDLRIAIRGFGARAAFGIRGIKLLLDGIPESAPDGQAQVDNLDLATVNRLEVLRGASGGLYGNASGGVLSLRTDPVQEKPFIALRCTGGSYGFRQLHVKGGARSRNSGFWASLTHQGLDGYREHAALRSTLANAKWAWTPDSTLQLSLLLNYVNSPKADDAGALTSAQVEANRRAANPNSIRYDAGESVQQGRIGVVLEKSWSERQRLRLRGYSVWRDFDSRLPLQSGGQVAFQRWFAGGGAQYEGGRRRWRWSAGFDLDRQADDRQRYDNLDGRRGVQNLDQREIFTGAGLYALAEWKPATALTLSGGARLDLVQLRVDDFFEADGVQSGESNYRQLSPWAGALLRLNPRLHAYLNGTTNFETPTLNELSNNPSNTGGFNPNLRPQRTVSAEAGFRGRGPMAIAWEIALFYTVVQDELTPYELADFPGRTFYRNAGQTRRQGVEASVSWLPLPGLQVLLSHTYAHFQYRKFATPAGDFAGRQMPGLPRHWGQLDLRYRHRGGVFANGQLRYTGRFYADDANAQAVKPYLLLNLRVGYRHTFSFGDAEVFAGLDNASGTAYFNNIRVNAGGGRYFEPGARQLVFGGLEISLIPGRPRH